MQCRTGDGTSEKVPEVHPVKRQDTCQSPCQAGCLKPTCACCAYRTPLHLKRLLHAAVETASSPTQIPIFCSTACKTPSLNMGVCAVRCHPVHLIMNLKDPCSNTPERTFDDSVAASLNIFPPEAERQHVHFRWPGHI
ncbi:hypothetical protein TNCV_303541 [Trichonephila clavipes]|nr:hypothetical protein TNCV_303541 [Trichonephila clavipes]